MLAGINILNECFGRKHDFLVSLTKDWEIIKRDEKALEEYLK